MNNNKDKNKNIKIPLSPEEHKKIKEEADKRHITMKEYARLRLLDDTCGANNLSRQIMIRMPVYIEKAKEIENDDIRYWFTNFGGKLCQTLSLYIQ